MRRVTPTFPLPLKRDPFGQPPVICNWTLGMTVEEAVRSADKGVHLDRVSTLATQKPELKRIEPFKTVLSGDREAAGLNKGEAHNGHARAVFFNRLGELRDRIPESQRSQPCCRANNRNSRSTG